MYNHIPLVEIQVQTLSTGIKISPDVFQNVMSKLTQDMDYVKIYLDDLFILTFKYRLTKLEMVLERLSTAGMRVNASKSKISQNRLSIWATVLPEKESSQYTISWKPFLRLRIQKLEKNYANSLAWSSTTAICGFAGVIY
jgi:hypothetical protein